MTEKDTITLEWTFTPPDLFEEAFTHDGTRCTFEIESGKVIGRFTDDTEPDRETRAEIQSELTALFSGATLIEHKPFTLSEDAALIRTHPDGRRSIAMSMRAGAIMTMMGKADMILKDREGNVVRDSRAERIQDRKDIAVRGAKHRDDPVLAALLASYRAATNEPDIELIRLYEIRDALSTHFDGNHKARRKLGIPNADWNRLGELANDAPLNQGRHRGWNIGQLRDATDAELTEARRIAVSMIRAYLDHLDRTETP